MVLMCEHPYDLRFLCLGGCCYMRMFWYFFLDFGVVLFQSGVFEYVVGGWGACCVYLQNVFLYAEKTVSGAKNEVARYVWEFQRSPSRRLSSMVKCIFIPEDKHAMTNLDNYGL